MVRKNERDEIDGIQLADRPIDGVMGGGPGKVGPEDAPDVPIGRGPVTLLPAHPSWVVLRVAVGAEGAFINVTMRLSVALEPIQICITLLC